jgi:hypothetical protein
MWGTALTRQSPFVPTKPQPIGPLSAFSSRQRPGTGLVSQKSRLESLTAGAHRTGPASRVKNVSEVSTRSQQVKREMSIHPADGTVPIRQLSRSCAGSERPSCSGPSLSAQAHFLISFGVSRHGCRCVMRSVPGAIATGFSIIATVENGRPRTRSLPAPGTDLTIGK